jgi:hypothetical protein
MQTMPSAYTDSGHNFLVAKICTTLKKNHDSKREKEEGIWRSDLLNSTK